MLDNDALIKFGAWDLIDKSIRALEVSWTECRRLQSIKYMLPTLKAELTSSISESQFASIVDAVARMPVLDEEIDADLANELLEISDIDPGEAAIFSGMLSAESAELLTGDKRALSAFAIAAKISYIESVTGRCHCVESQLLRLINVYNFEDIVTCLRNAVEIDGAVRICLGSKCDASKADVCFGLKSFAENFDGATLIRFVGDDHDCVD